MSTVRRAARRREKDKAAPVTQIETLRQCFEITSLVGTVSVDGAHLHVTLRNRDGATVSGHVIGDLVVQTTAEIVLGEAVGANFTRVYDSVTGWPELKIEHDPLLPLTFSGTL